MKWLKDNYKEVILNFFLSTLGLLFILWVTGIKDSDASIKKDIEELKIKKAPYEYVDKQNESQDQRIEIIRKENRDDHIEIIRKLDEIIRAQSK